MHDFNAPESRHNGHNGNGAFASRVPIDFAERVVRLEERHEALSSDVGAIRTGVERLTKLLEQARGAMTLVIVVWTIGMGVLGAWQYLKPAPALGVHESAPAAAR